MASTSVPDRGLGFQLRDDANRPVRQGMLDQLRDVFRDGRRVRLEYVRTGCRVGTLIRVVEAG
jgi:hypothetical protein